jgi:ParB family chromosome partitioning protein
LGRGLEGILQGGTAADKSSAASGESSAAALSPEAAPKPETAPTPGGYAAIGVAEVVPNPYQPRREIEPAALEELAGSIREEGLLQPIVVRPVGEGYQLIAGERRWRAFQHLGEDSIPARIMEGDDARSASLALIENLQREELNPVEEALGLASLVNDFDLTQAEAARRVGKGRATIANALRLLQLSPEILQDLASGRLSPGHAKVLLGVEEERTRLRLAQQAAREQWSVRRLEEAVAASRSPTSRRAPTRTSRTAAARDSQLEAVRQRVEEHLHAPVQLESRGTGGQIRVRFEDGDDLQRILDRLGIRSVEGGKSA